MKKDADGPASDHYNETSEDVNKEKAEKVYKTIVKEEVKYSWLMTLLGLVAASFVIGMFFTDHIMPFLITPIVISTIVTSGIVLYDKHIQKENRKQIQKYVDEHANDCSCQYLVMMYEEKHNR